MNLLECTLPGGFVDEGGRVHRRVVLAPLTGQAEKLVAEQEGMAEERLVTALLAETIQSIGPLAPVGREEVRRLLVGDRQYLLVKLRELTFGGRIEAVLRCPDPACGERMDIDFSTGDIPVRAAPQSGLFFRMEVAGEQDSGPGDDNRTIRFRLPNGADQEEVAPVAEQDEILAQEMLLGRCLAGDLPAAGYGAELLAGLSPEDRLAIEEEMAHLAPRVGLTMDATCPECGVEFSVPFHLSRFFLGELRTRLDLLLREVHYLAFHYHWSAKEILEMPRSDRRRYIEILSDEIERMNQAVRGYGGERW